MRGWRLCSSWIEDDWLPSLTCSEIALGRSSKQGRKALCGSSPQ
jgi:hypothetical protein